MPGTPIPRPCLVHLYDKSKCAPEGTYNPDPALKNPIPEELKGAQRKGDVAAATKFYTNVRRTADNKDLSTFDRYNAFMGCYGIKLKQI
jgi:hypothetical protein